MGRKSTKDTGQPVFFVEKPLKKRGPKKNESYHDKSAHTKPPASKNKSATVGMGQKRGSSHNPPEQRASAPEDKRDTTAQRTEVAQAHAASEPRDEHQEERQDHRVGQGETSQAHEPRCDQEAHEQGRTQDGQGQARGKDDEEGERRQTPVLDERAQKLEAARKRAVEVRKEKAAARRAAKDSERAAQEHRVKESKIKEEKLEKVFPRGAPVSSKPVPPPEKPEFSEVIPQPLPQRPPPRYLSAQAEDLPETVKGTKTTRDIAYPKTVDEQLPPLKRSKMNSPAREPAPVQGERVEPEQKPMEEDDDEKYIAKKRRELEKKRLLREEMELDRAFAEREEAEQKRRSNAARPVPAQDAPAPRAGLQQRHLGFGEDPFYRHQMNTLRRNMLMEAIFGSKV